MIIFNECRIDKEGKNLIIDAKVDSLSYYDNIYIKSITIDTDETFIENGPSSNYIYTNNLNNDTTLKSIRLKINYKELKLDSLNDNILFVYIRAGGAPSADTPCGMDNEYSVAVAVNIRSVYNMAMSYLKELEGTCTTPKGFIDMILRLKAFELSLKTGNFITAIEQWDKLFKKKRIVSPTKGCGCNGIYP